MTLPFNRLSTETGELFPELGERAPLGDNFSRHPNSSWIRTLTSRRVDPFAPDPAMIDVDDIALALGMQVRWGGHIKFRYSTAEHVVNCARVLGARGYDKRHMSKALHHDDDEAYLIDVPRPIKNHPLMAGYRAAQKELQRVCLIKFTGDAELPEIVHWADNVMLLAEAHVLTPGMQDLSVTPADVGLTVAEIVAIANTYIVGYSPKDATLVYQYMHASLNC